LQLNQLASVGVESVLFTASLTAEDGDTSCDTGSEIGLKYLQQHVDAKTGFLEFCKECTSGWFFLRFYAPPPPPLPTSLGVRPGAC